MTDYKLLEDKYLANIYAKRPVLIVKGRGARVWDADGREYIDCIGGHGVCIVGHCHPRVVEAIGKQSERLMTCSGILYNDVRGELGEKLCSITPEGLDKVFLSNSGTEAVECAIKLARKHTGKKEIIAMMKGFHGRTMGALSATWKREFRRPFEPLVPGFKIVKLDMDEIRRTVTQDTAAILFEPVQGESGVYPPPQGIYSELREFCDSRGILLIADEVQTGFGRTGKMFACEHLDVVPDVMCLAKGLGGGFPIGATVARAEVMDSFSQGEHGSTFGGNPLACAAAIATLNVIVDENLPGRAARLGEHLLGEFHDLAEKYNIVREERGLGLMLALEFRFPHREIILDACEKGLLTLSSGLNIMRFLPPLIISREELDTTVSILDEVCAQNEK